MKTSVFYEKGNILHMSYCFITCRLSQPHSRTYWCAATAILCGGQCNEGEVLVHRSKVCPLSPLGHELLGSTEQNKREKVTFIIEVIAGGVFLRCLSFSQLLSSRQRTCEALLE